jgi:hypothetical protein
VTPEGRIKAKVDAVLKKYGAYYLKPVQNGMGAPAVDYHGIANGHGFVIETKAPGGAPTARQLHTLSQVRKAGGSTFVISCQESIDAFEAWLICITQLKDSPYVRFEPTDD